MADDVPSCGAGSGSGWDRLPAECKLIIFELLSMRDLARAARTCREFAAHIRSLRASLTVMHLPSGLAAGLWFSLPCSSTWQRRSPPNST